MGAEWRANKLTASEYDETTWSARTFMAFTAAGTPNLSVRHILKIGHLVPVPPPRPIYPWGLYSCGYFPPTNGFFKCTVESRKQSTIEHRNRCGALDGRRGA